MGGTVGMVKPTQKADGQCGRKVANLVAAEILQTLARSEHY